VFGALTPAGDIDFDALNAVAAAAAPLPLTFHRAIDMTVDPVACVAALAARAPPSVERVLTSGGATSALLGASTIARMVAVAGRLHIMAGGGVSQSNARELVQTAGVRQLHASARIAHASPMVFRNTACFMAGERRNDADTEFTLMQADPDRARAILTAGREACVCDERTT
jgi:copper homeostasis protein